MTFERVVALHEKGILASGGSFGPPRPGCVEGSIGAATSAAMYAADDDAMHMAAYLLVYLARNHCFPDGNKRAAWLCFVDALSPLNVAVDAPPAEMASFVEDVAQGFRSADDVLQWVAPYLQFVE